MSNIIKVEQAEYEYPKGGFRFRCGSLALCGGESLLIHGLNGSGKTTLGKLMCGILKPRSGKVLVSGEDTRDISLGRIGRSVGYLFQDPAKQLFSLTVWEEVLLADSIKGTDSEAASLRANELLEMFGLHGLKNRSVYRLSRGEKQRLALCTIFMQGAKALILDEPTTGLDRENRFILYESLDGLLQKGIGLAIITHDKELKARSTGPTVRVHDGEVFA